MEHRHGPGRGGTRTCPSALDRRRKGHDRAACGTPSPSSSTRSRRPARPPRRRRRGSLWFSPLRVGRLDLTERTWVPAMVPWRATDDGLVTPEVLAWYERFARGQPGALVVEATGIRDIPSGPLLRIGDDRFIPGLAELVRTVRRASGGRTRLFIQIIDFLRIRRRPEPERYFRRVPGPHRPAPRAAAGHRRRDPGGAGAIAGGGVAAVPERAGAGEPAVRRAGAGHRYRAAPHSGPATGAAGAVRRCGAPGGGGGIRRRGAALRPRLHHGVVPLRAEPAGGRLRRLAREPGAAAARGLPGRARRREPTASWWDAASWRRSAFREGGTAEDAAWFGAEFARAGMDYLSLSRGGKFEDAKQPRVGWARYPYTGPSGYECMPTVRSDERGPFGRNRAGDAARCGRLCAPRGADTPVVLSGGISTFEQAEALLRDGAADIVASARQSLADPDWFRKLRLGLGDEVRRCVFTNYCEGLDQVHKPVTCKLWDHLDLRATTRRAPPTVAAGWWPRRGSRPPGERLHRRGGARRPLPRHPAQARRPEPPGDGLRAQPARGHLRLRGGVLRRDPGERGRGGSRAPTARWRPPRRAGRTSRSTTAAPSCDPRGHRFSGVERKTLLELLAGRAQVARRRSCTGSRRSATSRTAAFPTPT